MKTLHRLMIGLIALTALQTFTLAQPATPPGAGAAPAAAPTTSESGSPRTQEVLPELKFDGASLDEVLNYIRKIEPRFNYVVVREPGVDAKYPILPAMQLKNVNVAQFLDLIKISYPIEINQIDGSVGSIIAIKIQATPQSAPAAFAPNPTLFGGGGGAGGRIPLPQTVVRVYSLAEIVEALAGRKFNGAGDLKEFTKGALNDVLSLVQAALEQTEGDDKPVLKVHEGTLTLLFKGSPAKQSVVEEVLGTLRPKEDVAVKAQIDKLNDQIRDSRANMSIADQRIASLRRELEARENELQLMRIQFNQLNHPPTTQPKE